MELNLDFLNDMDVTYPSEPVPDNEWALDLGYINLATLEAADATICYDESLPEPFRDGQPIVLDIETGPLPDSVIEQFVAPFPEFQPLGPFNPDDVKLGNLKDQAKIAAKINAAAAEHARKAATARDDWEAAQVKYWQDIRDEAALNPLTSRILAIGYRQGDRRIIHGCEDEAALIHQMWVTFKRMKSTRGLIVGHNVKGFDFPYARRRSWAVGVPIPAGLLDRNLRYWHDSIVDTKEIWQAGTWGGKGKTGNSVSLSNLALHLGVGYKDGSGENFAEWWSRNRDRAVCYLCDDLDLTWACAERMGVRMSAGER